MLGQLQLWVQAILKMLGITSSSVGITTFTGNADFSGGFFVSSTGGFGIGSTGNTGRFRVDTLGATGLEYRFLDMSNAPTGISLNQLYASSGLSVGAAGTNAAYFEARSASGGAVAAIFRGAAARTVTVAQIQTDVGASLGNIGGCVFDHIADASSTSTDGTLNTIYTDTTVANSLAVNGDKIAFDYTLAAVANATATRRFTIDFAGINIFDSTALAFVAAGTIRISGTITRVTSTTCQAVVDFTPAGSAAILAFRTSTYTPPATLTGLTLSGTNVLVLKGAAAGDGAASADIVGKNGTISIIPSGS